MMKRVFSAVGILVIFTFCAVPMTHAQQPVPQDLAGTWEMHTIIEGCDWGQEPGHGVTSFTATISFIEDVNDPTEPNLYIDLSDSDDDFVGFARSGMFAFYKENIDNCGGPPFNFGREMIIGTLNNNGNRFRAKGMGFDSDPECGGT